MSAPVDPGRAAARPGPGTWPLDDTVAPRGRLALTVGPVLYHWPRTALLQFYAELADSPADTLVLGEVVCARRRELKLADWLALARELAQAGKDVVLAAQAMVETEADVRQIEHLAEQGQPFSSAEQGQPFGLADQSQPFTSAEQGQPFSSAEQGQPDALGKQAAGSPQAAPRARLGDAAGFAVEAADASALHLLAGRVPLVLGPHLNIYSRPALVEHADLGATRWVAPVELSLDAIAAVNPPTDRVRTPDGQPIETEAWVFGRVPLSFSARCFTARHHGLAKDQCEYRCLADGDGLPMQTSDGRPFLVLNGTQTQSAAVQCLLADGAALRAAGIARLRLSPCAHGFGQVLRDFDAVMNHGAPPYPALAHWPALGVPLPLANGYARRQPGISWEDR